MNKKLSLIVSNWKREGVELTMEVTIPPNTTATVYVPTADAATVTESGKPAEKAYASSICGWRVEGPCMRSARATTASRSACAARCR